MVKALVVVAFWIEFGWFWGVLALVCLLIDVVVKWVEKV